jgi:DNA-binding HxlR family transcriptional regulator
MTGKAGAETTRGQTEGPRSTCPIASTLDLIGDRWTLLLVRDLIAGKTRFSEFLASDERWPTNVLADRVRRLERHGMITSVLYSQHPPRAEYHLTPKGHELEPVLQAMGAWGLNHIPGTERRLWLDDPQTESRAGDQA